MTVITVDFGYPVPSGPPYLDGRDPAAVLQQVLDTELADGNTVRDVARLAIAGDEESAIRLGFFGLRVEGAGVILSSPARFSQALPVAYENGALHAFHAMGSARI